MSDNTERREQTHSRRGGGPGGPGGPSGTPGEKPKNFKQSVGKLVRYVRTYLPAILVAFVFSVASSVITIIGPDRISEITDLISEGLFTGIDLEAVARVGLTMAVLYGLGAVFNYVQSFVMATVTQRVAKSLRSDISKKINVLPLRYFDGTTVGNTLSRVTNDVDTVSQSLNQSVSQLVSSVTLFFGTLLMMFLTNVTMTLAGLGATAIGFILMMVIMSRSQKYFTRQQRELGEINGHIEEMYSGHNIVKAYNGGAEAKSRFAEINTRLRDSAMKSQFMGGVMMPIMSFIGNLGYVVICIVGGMLATSGSISFGVIVAFLIYVRLFTQPLSQMAQVMTSMQSAAAASERIFEFLDQPELDDESHKTKTLANVRGEVEFDHVVFGYDPDRIIIRDFSAHAMPGQKIAIVGPTGAGKTTMVNLLMRFYELNSGSIKIDGVPHSDITRENVHSLFCMVLQDTWLFEGTIKENIIYCKEGVADEEVYAACRAVGVDHFIRSLPDGYNTILGDNSSLSAGQRQLITIARAMIENAPMLILDEATSSVDTRTEELIQKAMDTLMAGRTSFVIAHRLSTIKNADLILVMNHGDIVENGTHEELLARGGFYAELYNSQFEQVS